MTETSTFRRSSTLSRDTNSKIRMIIRAAGRMGLAISILCRSHDAFRDFGDLHRATGLAQIARYKLAVVFTGPTSRAVVSRKLWSRAKASSSCTSPEHGQWCESLVAVTVKMLALARIDGASASLIGCSKSP